LVTLYDSSEGLGKKPRTSHVKLTARGRELAIFYALGNGDSPPKLTYDATYMALDIERIETRHEYEAVESFRRSVRSMKPMPTVVVNGEKVLPTSEAAVLEIRRSQEVRLERIRQLEAEIEKLHKNPVKNPRSFHVSQYAKRSG
jgi:hypothetical protein